MNPFRALTGKQAVAALEKHGFAIIRVRGSHQYLRHPDGRGLMAKILRDAELSQDQLLAKPRVAP
jgi:predicted RNA binding protein YcfA (HicA-like mRNA interferase family)